MGRHEGAPDPIDDLLGCGVGTHRLLDEVVHHAGREHWSKILEMDEIEDALNLFRSIVRSTSRVSRQMLESDGAIVRVFTKKLGRFYGKKLVRMPPLGCDRGIAVARHIISRHAAHPPVDQRQRGRQQFLGPERFDPVERHPDGFHGAGTMDPVEDRLIVAHLLDQPCERVIGYDRGRRVIRVPDIEVFSGPEVDVVPMGHRQAGVRVQDIQQAVQLIREQDIVVRTKGTVGQFNRSDA